MIYDLLIIGGGASGTCAAISYKRNNPHGEVLILESLDDILKKVSATGNGKGNFTNDSLSPDSYNSSSFVEDIFPRNPLNEVLSFFDSLGMKYRKDSEGRYYPYSDSAKTLSYVLRRELKRLNVAIKVKEKVYHLAKDDFFHAYTNSGEYEAKKLLIAVGGKNYGTLGSDGSLFKEIENLGHHFTALYPTNIYIPVKEKDVTKKLSGLRFDATIYLINNHEMIYYERGELLFKDDALSGIVSFNVSNRLSYLLKTGTVHDAHLAVDFASGLSTETLNQLLLNTSDSREALLGVFQAPLVDVLLSKAQTGEELIKWMTAFPFTVDHLDDFEHAQETAGGIRTVEIKSNLESAIIPGLFFSGDIIDVDAASGGYNLSFAFLSGLLVGRSANE